MSIECHDQYFLFVSVFQFIKELLPFFAGTKGRTKKILLDKLFHNDFERGSKESYYITVPVIGDVKFVQLFLIGGKYTFKREWFLSNIVLMDLTTRKLFELPVYRWINDKLTLPTGEGNHAL